MSVWLIWWHSGYTSDLPSWCRPCLACWAERSCCRQTVTGARGVQCPAWSPSSDYVELLDLVLAQSWHDRYWGTGPSYVILTLDMHYANTHFKHKGINKSWSKVKVMCRIYWPFQVRDYRNSNINIFRLRSISSNILWILLKLIL